MADILLTFSGISVWVQGPDVPSYSSRARIRMIRIPGGDRSIIQRNPTNEHTLEVTAIVDAFVLDALRAKVQTIDTLSFATTNGSALLMRVDPKRVWRNNTYLTTLSFKFFRGYGFSYGTNFGE
jgi:hypothetical protein